MKGGAINWLLLCRRMGEVPERFVCELDRVGDALLIDRHGVVRRPSQWSDSEDDSSDPEPVIMSACPVPAVVSPAIRPISIDPVLIPLPMVFAQMPPFCHPFPPLPKPDPNGAPCVIRGGSSPLPLDDVATLPKRFFVVVDAMSGDAAVPLQTQFNPLSSIKAAHESVAWHLFHVSVLRRQFTLAGRYTADSDINRKVSMGSTG